MARDHRSWAKRALVAFVSAIVGTALGALTHHVELFEWVDLSIVDWGFEVRRYRSRHPHPDLAFLEIDDRSLARIRGEGGSVYPLSRKHLADVIEALTIAEPAVIALDVLLDEETEMDGGRLVGDAARLQAAIEAAGNVVIAADLEADAGGAFLGRPLEPYSQAAAAVGHTNVIDVGGLARRFDARPAAGGLPHLATQAVELYRRHGGAVTGAAASDGPQELNFLGPPGTFGGPSTADLLAQRDQLAPIFTGKVVCVGATFLGNLDVFRTPFNSPLAGGGRTKMAGVELIANCINQLLTGEAIVRPSRGAIYLGALLAAAICAAAFVRFPLWAAGFTTLGVLLAAFALALWQFVSASVSVPISPVIVAVATGSACAFGSEFLAQRQLRAQLERIFGGYVSDEVFEHLVAEGLTPELGGETRECSILFSDIRDYGTLSERLRDDPHAIVSLLNEHFSAMTECIQRHGGCVNNFVGDLIVGVFGVPQADPDHCYHAVCAALDMLERIEAQNVQRRSEGRDPVKAGIGVHCGKVVAGNIGSPRRMNYTVIGDAVNVASRLESATKEQGVPLLVSGEVAAALAGRIEAELVAVGEVKSRAGKVEMYGVRGRRQAAPVESADEGV